MNKTIISMLVVALSTASLLGCASYEKSKASVDLAHSIMSEDLVKKQNTMSIGAVSKPSLMTNMNGNWLGVKVKPLAQEATLPSIFKSNVTLTFPGRVNLRTIAERLTKVTGIAVTLKPDVFMPTSSFVGGGGSAPSAAASNQSTPQQGSIAPSSVAISNTSDDMELNFTDTQFRDVLNQICSRFGINWTYTDNDGIVLSRLTTKTFTIKANPGDTTLTASLGKGGSSASSGSGISFSSNGNVSMNSSFSVWTGMQSVIDTIKSPVGKYFINQATGTITMTDTKEVVDIVGKYIDSENQILTQQVAIRVEVLSVSATDSDEAGINWSGVFTKLNNLVPQWSTTLSSPSSLVSTMAGSFGMSILAPVSSSNSALASLSGSQAMISALKGYAKITNRQTFSAITLNRQPAPLAKTSQLSYLARTTPGTSGTGGSALPGLEPGLLTTGFLSNIVPTVLDNQSVLLQFSIDSSELKSLGVISTGQGATLQSIQTPQVDAVQTVQRVALKSGATLVLTGFEREVLRYDQRGLTEKIGLGGSYSGQSNKESVVIILTPVIVDGA
jgi:type IVB pilus formation R64 PilN family outer membrane protein